MKKVLLFLCMVLLVLFPAFCFANTVTVTWDPNTESDLAGYRVYYGTASGVYTDKVDVGNQTGAIIENLLADEYFFVATAYDTSGNESAYSNEVSIDMEPPNTVNNLKVEVKVTVTITTPIDIGFDHNGGQ